LKFQEFKQRIDSAQSNLKISLISRPERKKKNINKFVVVSYAEENGVKT
jgi:hypothetical protein